MQFILVLFILFVPIACLLVRDALCNKPAMPVEVVSKDCANPEAYRQCVETKRNASIEIKLEGRSFGENGLWYATLNTPGFGMLIDYSNSILAGVKKLYNKNILTYTPERNFVGTDRFYFVVFDGKFSEVAYVVIKVTDRDLVNSVSRQQSITSIRKKELGIERIMSFT
jgi:hypothetical protein